MSPRALVWSPTVDRRTCRSHEPAVAASIYLERVVERCSLDAIALRSLGSSAIAFGVTGLGEVGARLLEGDRDAGLDGVDVFAHPVTIGREACVLVTAGARVDRVKAVAADLSRILA